RVHSPMRPLLVIAALAASANLAAADDRAHPRAHPPAHAHTPAHAHPPAPARMPDVAAALATRDPARICQLAIDLATAGDAPRASLLLPRCGGVGAGTALADAARKARIAVRKLADAQDWSSVELVVSTPGAAITVEPYPDVPVDAGALLLPAGHYRFVART